jgi:hypothetical protein
MSKHTPRPWKIGPYGEVYSGESEDLINPGLQNIHSTAVCKIENWRENQANANLISAAPDLFQALNKVLIELCSTNIGTSSLIEEARKALEKAEGLHE